MLSRFGFKKLKKKKKNFAKMLTREIFKKDLGQRREWKLHQLDSAEKVFDCDIKCTSTIPSFTSDGAYVKLTEWEWE